VAGWSTAASGTGAQDETRRARLVERIANEWKHALIDLGGRNNLLHYRDLKLGTLDLMDADPHLIRDLLFGKSVRVSSLFDNDQAREQAVRRARTIHNKAKENSEERGLETVSVGYGMATWSNKRGAWTPAAPVLLQSASLSPIGAAQDDFELAVTGDMEVNPILLHALKVDFGCECDHVALTARIDGAIDEPWELLETYKWISEQARDVVGFHVDERVVLANFAYAKLEMVRDLDSAIEELVRHDLIAALAGDEEAQKQVRGQGTANVPQGELDQIPLADEFLILDADSSQNFAINAVLGGMNLIIKGPPGTGKSQTISNLIASLTAHGKRVLFVAEKRAAIEAVTKRLGQRELGDLVLDLHGGITSKRALAQAVGTALAAVSEARRVDNGPELARVENLRDRLNSHVRVLHDTRQPWGLSLYEIQAELLGLRSSLPGLNVSGRRLVRLDKGKAEQAERDLVRYADLGGLTLSGSGSPWARSRIATDDEVRYADSILDGALRETLPQIGRHMERACRAIGLPFPMVIADWKPLVDLWAAVAQTAATFSPGVYSLDLVAELSSLAPVERGGFARLIATVTSSSYRAAGKRVREMLLPGARVPARALYAHLRSAESNLRAWHELGGSEHPAVPEDHPALRSSYQTLLRQLAQLEAWTGTSGLAAASWESCTQALQRLDHDRATLAKLPELHRLRERLESAGLGHFVAALSASPVSADVAVRSFRFLWLRSIIDHIELTDPSVSGFSGVAQQRAVHQYDAGDRRHISTTPSRIRRAYAEAVITALDEFPEQATLVRRQAALKRKHMAARDFVRNAADVLLALKPCWAMSPLVVSQLLPAKPYFDVVIFDEASQITPADAATSILRGRQTVVAGDDKQLPPTAFFSSGNPDDDPTEEEEIPALLAGTSGFESILEALDPLLTFRTLTWHYRSRDERLIAFSNAEIYNRMLTTFPGADHNRVLSYIPAPWSPSADTNSPAPEVDTVVNLIFEHAREHPEESLGVITMGIRHANRIEESLRKRLHDDPALARRFANFFDENREERFFVKNIERVQGDERDAIILSVGYGKNSNGTLPYRFGPLLVEGGERRLNVSVTRAKNRLTLVSSFSSSDMAPDRSAAEGVRLLRLYLQYVESGGANLSDDLRSTPVLNPFEVDVMDTLTKRGLILTPQYGASGYRIDFAVSHPDQPGRHVLAIECDGASYHASPSARDRDRLRQEQLERLGWRFHRIWSTEWFRDKNTAADRAVIAYEDALLAADSGNTTTSESQPADEHSPTEQSSSVDAPMRNVLLDPHLVPGQPIGAYSDRQLERLARWIRSDEVLRTQDELLDAMMWELGFQRRGKNVVNRLNQAINSTKP